MVKLKQHRNGSSNIHSFGHDSKTGELHVKFRQDGPSYIYSGVPAALHQAMHVAESAGRFFHANIKGRYAHRVGN